MNATLAHDALAATVVWRPLADADIEAVAALELAAHVAPWTEGNFRDALAAGYGMQVGAAFSECTPYLLIEVKCCCYGINRMRLR